MPSCVVAGGVDCAIAVAARSAPRQATIAVIEVFVFLLMFHFSLADQLALRGLLARRIVYISVQVTHPRTRRRNDPSRRKQPGFRVRFVVREDDVQIRNGDVLVCLRASQTGNQIANDIETGDTLVVGTNHDPGR